MAETVVLDRTNLSALDALPVAVAVVDHGEPRRNIWANEKYLESHSLKLDDFCKAQNEVSEESRQEQSRIYSRVQQRGETTCEATIVPGTLGQPVNLETILSPVRHRLGSGEPETAVLVTSWSREFKSLFDSDTHYKTALLDLSPYPLCFFNFEGHLITCNPAAVAVFGETIWLQSDIFGMGERERHGLNTESGDGPVTPVRHHLHERTERRTAYENMMDALDEEGATFSVDLPKRRKRGEEECIWYCRVFAQRCTDPITGEPIIMVSHQDVTNLRKVEGELGRMEMTEHANKELVRRHDSDVAGSL
eukprot:CAMPEP_0113703098 /NCGR_PEP_ID=MMETSP0038_2-20120614/25626_1 /TAXON_ID=2898 /ORGANISM="Cryptomonas paramecium" /LENGTH=306 /DNA_ID=CAMNT_0000627433 /DNA_START=14 /DNA_END=930 /DNA_ORIENTATION=+ /assembly_acc=CAM_ASM_000170